MSFSPYKQGVFDKVEEGDFLFVYGTLKSNRQASLCNKADNNRISLVSSDVVINAEMYTLRQFPGCIPSENPRRKVKGELYVINDASIMEMLDGYEGYNDHDEPASLFIRRRVPTHGEVRSLAWVYWYNQPVDGLTRMEGGIW